MRKTHSFLGEYLVKQFKNNIYPLLLLALPLAMTGLIQSATFFFETIFLAHLGPVALAAGAIVSWLAGTFAVILFGTLSSINILVAHKFGAKDKHGISLVVRDGVWLAILLSIPAVFFFWNISPIFLIFGQSPHTVFLAQSYLHALTWGLFPNFLVIALLEFIIGLGRARVILIFSILTMSMTIVFSFALIFGKFGLPALGVAGAGWGITIGNWITFILLSLYVLMNKEYRSYLSHLFTLTKKSYLLELIKVGAPMGLMYCVEVAFFFALTLVMGSFGDELLAANQIALQYLGVLMSIVFCIAQAITVRMGHLLGASEVSSAKQAAYAGICMSASLMFFVALCFWTFPSILISIDFNIYKPENLETVHLATQFLGISAIFQIIEATRISLFGSLRGLKDTHFTLLSSIIGFWGIALPFGYILATRFHLNGVGLWWGMVIGACVSVILLGWRFKSKIKDYT